MWSSRTRGTQALSRRPGNDLHFVFPAALLWTTCLGMQEACAANRDVAHSCHDCARTRSRADRLLMDATCTCRAHLDNINVHHYIYCTWLLASFKRFGQTNQGKERTPRRQCSETRRPAKRTKGKLCRTYMWVFHTTTHLECCAVPKPPSAALFVHIKQKVAHPSIILICILTTRNKLGPARCRVSVQAKPAPPRLR